MNEDQKKWVDYYKGNNALKLELNKCKNQIQLLAQELELLEAKKAEMAQQLNIDQAYMNVAKRENEILHLSLKAEEDKAENDEEINQKFAELEEAFKNLAMK